MTWRVFLSLNSKHRLSAHLSPNPSFPQRSRQNPTTRRLRITACSQVLKKLMMNSAIRNDGRLFGSQMNSHTGTKPAIDVAYQEGNGRHLSSHAAAGLADVNRARSLLSIGGRYGFARTVTVIEGIGSFQVRSDHDNHIHLGGRCF